MNATAPTLAGQAGAATFPCPKCRLAHPWSPEYAGRTARCGCGQVLKVPAALGTAAPEPAAARPVVEYAGPSDSNITSFMRAPAADEALDPEIEAELAATGRYGEGDPTTPDPKRDFQVPVALIVLGFLFTGADFAYTMHAHPGVAMAAGMFAAGVKLVLGMVLMLAGALAAAKFGGINFGPLGPALLKLAGICLAPSAAGDLVTTLLGGDMAVAQLGWVVRIVLYWALISYLFRLDGGQTAVVVGTLTIVKIVSAVLIASMVFIAVAPPAPHPGHASHRGNVQSLQSVADDAAGDN